MKNFRDVRRRFVLAGVSLPILFASVGCVNQSQYDDLYSANRALEERNVALQQEMDAKQSALALLQQRIQEGDSTVREIQNRNSTLNSNLVQMRQDYRGLNDRLSNASFGVLDPTVDKALRQFVNANPGIATYDSENGMVRFSSDLTFNSGSADVKPGAMQMLSEFARILAGNLGSQYDIRIVGHTDNVRPSKPATLRNHPTNMHLSVHRAIAVRNAIKKMGVPSNRIEVAGWGEFRPLMTNNPGKKGTSGNRRVEIFLVAAMEHTERYAEPVEMTEPPRANVDEPNYPMK